MAGSRRWLAKVGVMLVLLGSSRQAFAYPIEPVPLWSLVQRSSVIVVAKVEPLEEAPMAGFKTPEVEVFWPPALQRVRLTVLETWKGEPKKQLEVVYEKYMLCPEPARYEAGATVLAFLEEWDGELQATGLSYGALYPAEADLPVFRDRVREAIALQQSGEVSPPSRRAWLLNVAARRATRWHGLYELSPPLEDMDEARILAEGFISEPGGDSTLRKVLMLLADYKSRRFDAAAVAATETMMAGYLDTWAEAAVPLVLKRLDRQPSNPVHIELIKCDRGKALARFRECWKEAKKEFGIPEAK